MVAIEAVRTADASFTERPLVAVFIGATMGIGEYTVRRLTALRVDRGQKLRVYMVGRNKAAADAIMRECLETSPETDFRFVKADDLALLSDVDRVCAEITKLEHSGGSESNLPPRIDLLVLTQGQVLFGPRQDTAEGLDKSMSLLYYSRIRFITKFLPLLLASSGPAHVISVYAAGMGEGKLFPDDLSLRKNYSFANARSHVTYMKTLAFERLARQNPGKLSLVHTFPGCVITPSYYSPSLPIWFKMAWGLAGPIVRRSVAISPEENGLRMLFLATSRFPPAQASDDGEAEAVEIALGSDGQRGSGAYAVGSDSETSRPNSKYSKLREEGFSDKAWEHTMSVFQTIEAGTVFTA